MQGLLEGQVAVITGAGRGIGAAAARLFAAQGAKVVVSDLDKGPAESVATDIREEGGEAISVAGDVTAPEFPKELVDDALGKYGSVNILVNNAGFTWDGMLHKMSDKQWDTILDVHCKAPFRLIRELAPHMRDHAKQEQAEGVPLSPRCIINVSSVAGLHGNPGQINYSTAKAGIVGLTKTVAREWGPLGIRCNAVAFGFIQTRLTHNKEAGENITVAGETVHLGIPAHLRDMAKMVIPMGREGTPEEAAGGIFLLASPFASYINGHTLEVHGGLGI